MNQKKLLSLAKRYPIVIVCIVILLIAVVASSIRGSIIPNASEQKKQLSKELSKIKGNISASKSLKTDLEQLEEIVSKIEDRLIDPEERAINTEFFYTFGRANNMVISQVTETGMNPPILSGKSPNKIKSKNIVSFNLVFNGSYPEVLNVIKELYLTDRFMKVSDIKLSGNGSIVSAQMKLFVLAKK